MFDQTLRSLKRLVGWQEADAHQLAQYADLTSAWAETIVQDFYDTLFGYEPTARIFRPDERPAREKTLRSWYLHVLRGQVNDDFWRQQWRVGLVHIPRGVTNDFMLGMMSRIQQRFLEKVYAHLPPEEAQPLFLAFKRTTDVIAGLIAEGYRQGYIAAMQDLLGFQPQLMERMLHLHTRDLIERLTRLTLRQEEQE